MAQYAFTIDGKQYIGNVGGQASIGNAPAFSAKDMAAWLQANVEITGYEDLGDGTNVSLSFTPIANASALSYLESQTDENAAFFQLLRHKVSRRGAHSPSSRVFMDGPEEFDVTDAASYGSKSAFVDAEYAKGKLLFRYSKGYGKYAVSEPDSYLMVRTHEACLTLTAEDAVAGKIVLPWKKWIEANGIKHGQLPLYRRHAAKNGLSKPFGIGASPYTLWSAELVVASGKASRFLLEEWASRPERAWLSYRADVADDAG